MLIFCLLKTIEKSPPPSPNCLLNPQKWALFFFLDIFQIVFFFAMYCGQSYIFKRTISILFLILSNKYFCKLWFIFWKQHNFNLLLKLEETIFIFFHSNAFKLSQIMFLFLLNENVFEWKKSWSRKSRSTYCKILKFLGAIKIDRFWKEIIFRKRRIKI